MPSGPRKPGRIHRSTDFRRLYRNGKRMANALLAVYYLPNHLDTPRFGISVGKQLGKAVKRNAVKRVLREIIREAKPGVPGGMDIVVHARRACREATFQQIREAFMELMLRLEPPTSA